MPCQGVSCWRAHGRTRPWQSPARVAGDAPNRFGSGEYRAFFRNSQKFDNAMVGFLDCLAQLIGYARNADRTIKIPFE